MLLMFIPSLFMSRTCKMVRKYLIESINNEDGELMEALEKFRLCHQNAIYIF